MSEISLWVGVGVGVGVFVCVGVGLRTIAPAGVKTVALGQSHSKRSFRSQSKGPYEKIRSIGVFLVPVAVQIWRANAPRVLASVNFSGERRRFGAGAENSTRGACAP